MKIATKYILLLIFEGIDDGIKIIKKSINFFFSIITCQYLPTKANENILLAYFIDKFKRVITNNFLPPISFLLLFFLPKT